MRIGSVLIVKVDWVPLVVQLSAAQQFKLDHEPELLAAPHQILDKLREDGEQVQRPVPGVGPPALGD